MEEAGNNRATLNGMRFAGALLAAASLVWLISIVAAPYVLAHGSSGSLLAPAVYLAGRTVCHQRPERSFHPWGVQMPVCARCFGLYASAPLGAALALFATGLGLARRPLGPARARRVLFLAAIPTAVTVLVQWAGLAYPSSTIRALAAIPLGAAAAWVVVRAVEVN
jgi:uncharacterized membrane protein